MNVEGILALILIFGGGTLVGIAMSPIGQAIAARISPPRSRKEDTRRIRESQEAVAADLEAVRRELSELQERMDFAERMLAQQRKDAQLPGR